MQEFIKEEPGLESDFFDEEATDFTIPVYSHFVKVKEEPDESSHELSEQTETQNEISKPKIDIDDVKYVINSELNIKKEISIITTELDTFYNNNEVSSSVTTTHNRDCSENVYKCGEGASETLLKYNYQKHQIYIIHNSDKLFKCTECPYSTAHKHGFRLHMMGHTGEKPFKCEVCEHKTMHKHYVTLLHTATHSSDKQCEYRSVPESNVKLDKMIDVKEKPLKCELCHYTTSTKGSLHVHMRIHSGEKRFKCDHCKYKFTTKGSLQRHMMVHTGEKPFHCEECEYKSRRRSDLIAHMRCHNGEKPFKCSECDYASAWKHVLLRHNKRNHGVE